MLFFSGIRFCVVTQEEKELKEATITYLEEKGYDKDADVEKMSIINIGKDEKMKAVVVAFKDEPSVDYFYSYRKNMKQIEQIDFVNKGGKQLFKHKEE